MGVTFPYESHNTFLVVGECGDCRSTGGEEHSKRVVDAQCGAEEVLSARVASEATDEIDTLGEFDSEVIGKPDDPGVVAMTEVMESGWRNGRSDGPREHTGRLCKHNVVCVGVVAHTVWR